MTHFSNEEWKLYVKDELTQDQREQAEDHLYSCADCLEIYLIVVAALEKELPDLENAKDFTDQVMFTVKKQNQKSKKVSSFFQTALFHYTIAAVATIFLMTTGVFQTLTQYTDSVQEIDHKKKQTSVTEEVINITFSWLDSFEIKHKEANR